MGTNPLASYIITIVSSLFGAVFVVQVFMYFSRSQWGKFGTCLAGAAVAAFCIIKTDQAISILSVVGTKIVSTFQV
ncbi:hypothetical protein [Streptomyces prunicolor]|uniref:hypothetical protein n=1 Tax=Streptomyces prunicolor TaxID=67348 RepID=UPI00037F47A5|nr:hypothetical protein [Streptomyces prunicolor]